MSSSGQAVVCEEIFDEASHPSVEEIIEYAAKLGIDPNNEPQLLPLAAEGLMKALPPGWKPCYDDKKKSYYYYNNLSGKTQWEHPLDEIYRGIVVKKRAESQSLSLGEPTEDATYTRDELPSYEESPHPPKTLEPLSLGARKKDLKLSPLSSKLSPSGRLTDPFYPKLQKQKSEDKIGNPLTLRKASIHKFNSFDMIDNKKDEFKLTGGGSMFLKSNTMNKENSNSLQIKDTLSPDVNSQPKSILRERGIETSRSMEFPKSDKSDKDDDDKKSVRFNLDRTPDITFDFSDNSGSDNELKQIKNEVKDIINVSINAKPAKSRFTVSPVQDILKKEEPKNNLKLIKPHPKDFIKPVLHSSDEEDTSSNSREKDTKSLENAELNKGTTRNITKEKREVEKTIENQIEEYRKKIWEEKNEELQKYKAQIQQSQKSELERILTVEKESYEINTKKEIENLKKEMENKQIVALNSERLKLEEQLKEKINQLEGNYKKQEEEVEEKVLEEFNLRKNKLESDLNEKIEHLERDLNALLEKHKDELTVSHNAILHEIKQKHEKVIEEMKKDFAIEESIIRKEHQAQLTELRRKTAADYENVSNKSKDSSDEKMYEKIRCEKRLLEDKYRCLKEKYLRLKTEVKLTIEKRNKRREQSITTTGSETERSNSLNKERSPMHSPSSGRRSTDKPPTPKHLKSHDKIKPEHKPTRQLIIQDMDTSMSDHSYKNEEHDSSDSNTNPGRSRKKLFSRLKSSSTSRVPSGKSRKSQRSCSPVENLRRQLQKLEDLEDQFPQNTGSDTYHLRYPFTDDQKFEGSTELEFFRHRIHLERDSIKRAKEGLRSQKSLFQQRQKDLKLKHGSMARNTLQQLCQEEKELTDMEVSLHRTRSLLGEKIIRLRHLEQSLQRASVTDDQSKAEDVTLSDLSSHSASSGISSTEFAMADASTNRPTSFRYENFQESSEIIQSLENLNSEIREIWEVLHKQQQSGNINQGSAPPVPAPPSIPTLADRLHNYRQHVALANAQSTMVTHATQGATTTLVERTRNLRHWLRQTGMDSSSDNNPPQATL
ncbi:centrosomal protein of 164 kDa isoform X2 [Onthophagus taurus]|uniref:centrosomal protein of 164 kDa isoform X2 n=1 Tax=Onthophagus taurus TaxID=166361 RepID=UPI000C2085E2|nr:centrosomal protein of 164 kDa isoform X2 [Onthophagus taurus]